VHYGRLAVKLANTPKQFVDCVKCPNKSAHTITQIDMSSIKQASKYGGFPICASCYKVENT
jgi:hypothetical protein